MNCSKLLGMLALAALFLLCAGVVHADLLVLTSENLTLTAGRTVTNPANSNGLFDSAVARAQTFGTTGDLVRFRIENTTTIGTVMNITYSIRMNSTVSNDAWTIQYTNDSGTNWFTSQASVLPPATLTTYGNFTIYPTIDTFSRLNNTEVRVTYTRTGGSDNSILGIDGVEVYVTYAPPPNVTLTTPSNFSYVRSANVDFNFTPLSLISFRNCSVFINNTFNTTNQSAIANGTTNTITVNNLQDTDYLWNVACFDSSNFSNSSVNSYIVRIDTIPPTVLLFTPQNNSNTTKRLNNFTFNVTDNASILNCSLYIDDVLANNTTNPSKGTNINLSTSLSKGVHQWYVNCTDAAGWVGQSLVYTVNANLANITTNQTQYFLGQNLSFFGFNWDPGANVTVNITLANGTNLSRNVTANATGGVNGTQSLNITFPVGLYTIRAIQTNDSTKNDSFVFSVNMTAFITKVNVSPSVIVLNAGTTKTVLCNFTVNDFDGPGTISGANATFYTTPSTSFSAASNLTKYENSSCAQTASNATAKNFSCSVQVYYYATNGTWFCNGTGITADTVNSSVANFSIDPLYALDIDTPLMSFGTVEPGNTSSNITNTISNFGNQNITISALGYGGVLGDNWSFNCGAQNISIGLLKFAANDTATYDEKQNLSSSYQSLGLNLSTQNDTNPVNGSSYWQLQIPTPFPKLECNGTIVFQAG